MISRISTIVALLSPIVSLLPAQDLPATRTLSKGALSVAVMEPNDPQRYYHGIRFSPVALVLQANYQGRSFLFAPAVHNPQTDAGGLPAEFDLLAPSNPPGFQEATEGQGFIKVGVGVLARTGDEYRFFTPYQIQKLAATEVEWRPDGATFRQTCDGVNGYAYQLEADLQLSEDTLSITYRLKNSGTKPFSTEQYVHNFFAFGDQMVGPGYEIKFPHEFDGRIGKPVFEISGQTVRLMSEITEKMKAAEVFITAREGQPLDSATVTQASTGMQIATNISAPVHRVTIHASRKYFCPEQFVRIDLKPGESREWTRTYRFAINPAS